MGRDGGPGGRFLYGVLVESKNLKVIKTRVIKERLVYSKDRVVSSMALFCLVDVG